MKSLRSATNLNGTVKDASPDVILEISIVCKHIKIDRSISAELLLKQRNIETKHNLVESIPLPSITDS